jgi:hypothetical protein
MNFQRLIILAVFVFLAITFSMVMSEAQAGVAEYKAKQTAIIERYWQKAGVLVKDLYPEYDTMPEPERIRLQVKHLYSFQYKINAEVFEATKG